jgi:hypothetical protein
MDLAWLTVAEAAELLRGRKLSPVEYAKALIDRIERHDGKLNAFLRFTPELALEDARRAEAEIMRGAWRGPFHGVPYGLKDIVDYAGLPTTAHSKILQGNIAAADATVTLKLRAAGGVFMGKLSTHEFAIGGPSFDLPWPPARNPWNRDHFCGGSSSARRGDGGGLPARGNRHRHRRLGAHSRLDVRRRRHQAHLRPGEPARRAAAGVLARSCRRAHPHRARQRVDARSHRGPRSPRSRQQRSRKGRLHRRARQRREGAQSRRDPALLYARHGGGIRK